MHDAVTTRWNSTYDMLVFALQYRKALNVVTGDRNMKLRQYEMDAEEWATQQLCMVLKVSLTILIIHHSASFFSGFQGHNPFLLT